MTHPNCTSILAKQNILKFKTKAEATKLKEQDVTKTDYKKAGTHDQEKSFRAKRDFLPFSPMSQSQNEYREDGKKGRNYKFNAVKHKTTFHAFRNSKLVPDQRKYKRKHLCCPKPFVKLIFLIISIVR